MFWDLYKRLEEITGDTCSFFKRIGWGGMGYPYEHWMVNELRKNDVIT